MHDKNASLSMYSLQINNLQIMSFITKIKIIF